MYPQTFEELGASPAIADALARQDITVPFAVQTLVIPDALAGRDILAKSRTGTGKTLAFAVPIAELLRPDEPRPSALILVPTRELAAQVTDDLAPVASSHGLETCAVYGGVGLHDQAKRACRSHIVVATPGRLEDLVSRGLLRLDRVRILVLDEADRMLDMGFQPQVDCIVRRIPKKRQTMFFSATLDGEVGRLAAAYTTKPVRHEVASAKPTVEHLDHHFLKVTSGEKLVALVDLLRQERGLALVFVRTRRGADRLAFKLRSHGIVASAIHGDMPQKHRERSLDRFATGAVTTLIATDIAARGLDLDGISHVINFDPPEDHKAYLHRVGRTARAGRSGTGVTLVTPEQQNEVGRLARQLQLHEEFERQGLKVPQPALVFSTRRGRSRARGSGRKL
ncbi:MAG: DEAD/DEAH box helicase [Actinomycetota bacterium]